MRISVGPDLESCRKRCIQHTGRFIKRVGPGPSVCTGSTHEFFIKIHVHRRVIDKPEGHIKIIVFRVSFRAFPRALKSLDGERFCIKRRDRKHNKADHGQNSHSKQACGKVPPPVILSWNIQKICPMIQKDHGCSHTMKPVSILYRFLTRMGISKSRFFGQIRDGIRTKKSRFSHRKTCLVRVSCILFLSIGFTGN